MLGAGDGLIDRVLCVFGTVLFSQIPEFMQQYLQRLGGNLDQARRQLEQFQHIATESGLKLEQLISQTAATPDPAVAKLGGVMTETMNTVDALAAAQTAIQQASLWSRPFVFLHHVDFSIARATWSIFKPAVPTTIEGLVYALCGMLTLLVLYHLGIKFPVRRVLARRAQRQGA